MLVAEIQGQPMFLVEIGKFAGYSVFLLDFLKGVIATVWFKLGLVAFPEDPNLALWGLPSAVLGTLIPSFQILKVEKELLQLWADYLEPCPSACLLDWLVGWSYFYDEICGYCFPWLWIESAFLFNNFILVRRRQQRHGQLSKVILSVLIMGWIVWRHRSNLQRLRNGTENRFERKTKD